MCWEIINMGPSRLGRVEPALRHRRDENLGGIGPMSKMWSVCRDSQQVMLMSLYWIYEVSVLFLREIRQVIINIWKVTWNACYIKQVQVQDRNLVTAAHNLYMGTTQVTNCCYHVPTSSAPNSGCDYNESWTHSYRDMCVLGSVNMIDI